jgi:hypothetical protein
MTTRRFVAETEANGTVAAFFEALVRNEDRFVEEMSSAIRAEVAEAVKVPDEPLEDAIRIELRYALLAIAERRLPNPAEVADTAAMAANFARAGVTIEALHEGRRVAVRRTCELMREIGDECGLDSDTQVEFIYRMWEWADATQVSDAEVYRARERELQGGGEPERTHFARALLHGTLAPTEAAARATAYGLLPSGLYLAFRARPAPGLDAQMLARSIETTGGNDGFGVLVANVDGDLCGALTRAPRINGLGVVGLGPPAELTRLADSFQLANRALDTALAFGTDGVVTIDDLSLRPAILAESHLGERLVQRYLEPLQELGDFGTTLETTVREYLAHGMRIDESAKALFVHANTLRHRLDRFQQLTGADLRNTQHVVELWWALERRRLGRDPSAAR